MLTNVLKGKNVKVVEPVNLYGCELHDDVFVGPFVEIQRGVVIGPGTRVSSHSFVCEGVTIREHCFVGHGVMFINDGFDAPIHQWDCKPTHVGRHTRIGSNATIMPVHIGEHAIIGAGAVVVEDAPNWAVVAGNPARVLRYRTAEEIERDICELGL